MSILHFHFQTSEASIPGFVKCSTPFFGIHRPSFHPKLSPEALLIIFCDRSDTSFSKKDLECEVQQFPTNLSEQIVNFSFPGSLTRVHSNSLCSILLPLTISMCPEFVQYHVKLRSRGKVGSYKIWEITNSCLGVGVIFIGCRKLARVLS